MTTSHAAPTSTRRVVLAAGAVGLVLALLLAGALMLLLRGGDGPVRAGFTSLSYTDEDDQLIAVASIELRNSGDRDAVLEAVTPVDPPVGLDILDVQAVDTRRLDTPIGAQTALMLDDDLRPAIGARLPARSGSSLQLVFIVDATRPGRYAFSRTEIRYRVDDREHELTVPAGLTLVSAPGT